MHLHIKINLAVIIESWLVKGSKCRCHQLSAFAGLSVCLKNCQLDLLPLGVASLRGAGAKKRRVGKWEGKGTRRCRDGVTIARN